MLITGASPGIGRALALACARPGAMLHVSGRDAARLAAVVDAARARGAMVSSAVLDVRDAAGMTGWIAGAGRLDLVVANAGISAGGGGADSGEAAAQVRAIFAVNLDGALNTVLPALEAMATQPPGPDGIRGRIAVIASIAAFVAAPGAPAYCASKAAIDAWTVASAPAARARGVVLTSVCPGYVRTNMTVRNRFPMPGLMDAERAAGIILRGVASGRARVAFPPAMALAARAMGGLPVAVRNWMMTHMAGKAAGF
ncbi:MAG: SDR family NAD(P)-dependent oxidoreductase [Acetobacteraceae bacterium]